MTLLRSDLHPYAVHVAGLFDSMFSNLKLAAVVAVERYGQVVQPDGTVIDRADCLAIVTGRQRVA